jgi:hypothetical protein
MAEVKIQGYAPRTIFKFCRCIKSEKVRGAYPTGLTSDIASKYLIRSVIKLGFVAQIIKLPFVVVKIVAKMMVSMIQVPQIGTNPLAVLIA